MGHPRFCRWVLKIFWERREQIFSSFQKLSGRQAAIASLATNQRRKVCAVMLSIDFSSTIRPFSLFPRKPHTCNNPLHCKHTSSPSSTLQCNKMYVPGEYNYSLYVFFVYLRFSNVCNSRLDFINWYRGELVTLK